MILLLAGLGVFAFALVRAYAGDGPEVYGVIGGGAAVLLIAAAASYDPDA